MMLYRQLCYCEIQAVSQARMSVDTYHLEQFLKEVEKRAYRMAYIVTSNIDDALDIVQDAMMVLASKYASRDKEECHLYFLEYYKIKFEIFIVDKIGKKCQCNNAVN